MCSIIVWQKHNGVHEVTIKSHRKPKQNTQRFVRDIASRTESYKQTIGIKHVCILSPDQFRIYLKQVICKALKESSILNIAEDTSILMKRRATLRCVD